VARAADIAGGTAILEAVQDSAPDFAGEEVAKLTDKTTRLRQVLDAMLTIDQMRIGDLGGKANSAEFTLALVSRITNG
jgi:isocitrate dehydrogenase (NAD+)